MFILFSLSEGCYFAAAAVDSGFDRERFLSDIDFLINTTIKLNDKGKSSPLSIFEDSLLLKK
jgi:hypothetical protein